MLPCRCPNSMPHLNKKAPETDVVEWNPRSKSGHRMTALGFPVVPGMLTTIRDSPLGQ